METCTWRGLPGMGPRQGLRAELGVSGKAAPGTSQRGNKSSLVFLHRWAGQVGASPIQGTSSSSCCLRLIPTPAKSLLHGKSISSGRGGRAAPCSPGSPCLQAPGHGEVNTRPGHVPSLSLPQAQPGASQDARRGVGRREGSVPVPSLPLTLGYCAASFLLLTGWEGAGHYQGAPSDQVMQAPAASCLAWPPLPAQEGRR